MDSQRRNEIVLLCAVGAITALGMALVSVALGDSPLRATRGVALAGALLAITFLMDLTGQKRDRALVPIIAMICGLGLIMLWRLDRPAHQASVQIIWMVLGASLMLATYLLITDVRGLARMKYICGVGAVGLLFATMIWGEERYGARLWLDLGIIPPFQPGEFAKILMAIFLAGYVAERGQLISEVGRGRWGLPILELRHLAPVLAIVVFCLALFVTQRDLGAAVLFLGLAIAVMYLGTGRRTYVLLGAAAFVIGALIAPHLFAHVGKRIVAWLYPYSAPTGVGMQSLQAMFAFSEGGLLGTGLGMGMPYKMPAVATDLIFAAIGEELGLAGTCGLLALFAMATFTGMRIAWRCQDRFGMLLAAGLTTVIALQALVIVGGVIRVVPLTGITLPFVSYGGTSVITSFIMVGLLLAVSRDCWEPPHVRRHVVRHPAPSAGDPGPTQPVS